MHRRCGFLKEGLELKERREMAETRVCVGVGEQSEL